MQCVDLSMPVAIHHGHYHTWPYTQGRGGRKSQISTVPDVMGAGQLVCKVVLRECFLH